MSWNPVAKLLVAGGALMVIAGLLWQFGGKYLPLGKLPGDIAVERENFRFYFPLGSSILVSIVLSLLGYLFSRYRG